MHIDRIRGDPRCCRFDLAHYLDGQPMQFMMRPRGDKARPYFAFEMWHEKLLAAAQRHHS